MSVYVKYSDALDCIVTCNVLGLNQAQRDLSEKPTIMYEEEIATLEQKIEFLQAKVAHLSEAKK